MYTCTLNPVFSGVTPRAATDELSKASRGITMAFPTGLHQTLVFEHYNYSKFGVPYTSALLQHQVLVQSWSAPTRHVGNAAPTSPTPQDEP
jgi:hypothetical protein